MYCWRSAQFSCSPNSFHKERERERALPAYRAHSPYHIVHCQIRNHRFTADSFFVEASAVVLLFVWLESLGTCIKPIHIDSHESELFPVSFCQYKAPDFLMCTLFCGCQNNLKVILFYFLLIIMFFDPAF